MSTYLFFVVFLLWCCVFFPCLLLIFGCYFLLVFGYEGVNRSGVSMQLSGIILGDALIFVGLIQNLVQSGRFFAGSSVWFYKHPVAGIGLPDNSLVLLCFYGYGTWFDFIQSLSIGSMFESWSSVNFLSSNFMSPSLFRVFYVNISTGFGFILYSASSFAPCGRLYVGLEFAAQCWTYLLCECSAHSVVIKQAHSWDVKFWAPLILLLPLAFEGPIWVLLFFVEHTGCLLFEDVCTLMLFCNRIGCIALDCSYFRVLLGNHIIPTSVLNVSSCCMFPEISTTNACFGSSVIGWRGYAPLNL